MTVTLSSGKPTSSGAAAAAPTPRQELDAAVADLAAHAGEWAALPLAERLELLDGLIADFHAVSARWVEATRELEGLAAGGPFEGEEWLAGPYIVLRNLRLLRQSLDEIRDHGKPQIAGPVHERDDGQVVAQIFPASLWDRLFYPRVTAEVWMQPGVTREGLAATQAAAYEPGFSTAGRVALVLGAGNVTSIGPMDTLHKLFVEKQVVLYKSHPVQDAIGPLFEEAFARFVDRGFVRVAYGGAEVGAYLVEHPGVDEVHITGSDKTYEAIVFGPGEEGRARKAQGRPKLRKRVTAELGNVSPVIVVPGPWSPGDVEYQAENVVSMLTNNAGFNCNAARLVLTQAGWAQRPALLGAMRRLLAETPTRRAYYPGAAERMERFLEAHPEGERYGAPPDPGAADVRLPWVLLPELDPEREDDVAFRIEAFCSLFGEAPLEAPSAATFLDRAVAWCNETLWGTLNVTLIVHPDSLDDPETRAAFERAVEELRYGTVSINHWAAVGYGLAITPWGAFPGHTPDDVQSGVGFVHNTLLFERAQKVVIRSPFRATPKPPWFVSHKTVGGLAQDLADFERAPGFTRLPGIFWKALRG
jgi:hypothetical protein